MNETLEQRCGFDVPGRLFAIKGRDRGTQLAAVELGSGPTVAILLHQTDGDGLCGWVPFGRLLAAQGVHVLAVDVCMYGESVCSRRTLDDAPEMLRLAVEWARAHGAHRVTVVGASMGGSYAIGTGQAAGVDAIVDLSGPVVWPGVPRAVAAAPRIRVPLLVAVNKDTDRAAFGPLRQAVRRAPTQAKQFVAAPPGHGWDLVSRLREGATTVLQIEITAIGRRVRAWVTGS